jgi:hypothetical protein
VRVIIDGIEPAHEGLIRIREERDEALAEVKRLRGELDDALAAGEEAALDRDAVSRALRDLQEQQAASRVRALPQELLQLARHDPILASLVHVFARSSILSLRWLRERYEALVREALEKLLEEEARPYWLRLFASHGANDICAITTAHQLLVAAQDRFRWRLLGTTPTRWIFIGLKSMEPNEHHGEHGGSPQRSTESALCDGQPHPALRARERDPAAR